MSCWQGNYKRTHLSRPLKQTGMQTRGLSKVNDFILWVKYLLQSFILVIKQYLKSTHSSFSSENTNTCSWFKCFKKDKSLASHHHPDLASLHSVSLHAVYSGRWIRLWFHDASSGLPHIGYLSYVSTNSCLVVSVTAVLSTDMKPLHLIRVI